MHRFTVLHSVCSKSGRELDDWCSFPPRGKVFFFLSPCLYKCWSQSCFLSSLYFIVVSASETWMKHKADHISMYWHLITLPHHLHACDADVQVTLLLHFFIRHMYIILMGLLGFHYKQISLYELCDNCM
jgi:hypothetical protein